MLGAVSEQPIMHGPELSLRSRKLRSFCGLLGEPSSRLRHVPIHEAQLTGELFAEPLQDGVRLDAKWALVIAVFDQGHRRICRAVHVVMFGDWAGFHDAQGTPARAPAGLEF